MRNLYRACSVLRILIGAAFLYLGIGKLNDADFLYGGLMHTLEEYGRPWPFYQEILSRYVELHQTYFTFAVSIGAVLLGVSFLLGAFVSLSSFFGAVMVLNFGLATSYGSPERCGLYLAGALVLLLMGRMGAGFTWGLDGWLVGRLPEIVVLLPLRLSVPAFRKFF